MSIKNPTDFLLQATQLPAMIESALMTGAPKISTMLTTVANNLPNLPNFPFSLPDLPALATTPTPAPEPTPAPTQFPYPEEAPNYSNTVDNVNIAAIVTNYLTKYQVPSTYWPFWRSVNIILTNAINNPSQTSSQTLTIWMQPAWCNPGVLAHESSHISYYLLTAANQLLFNSSWRQYLSDPLMSLLLAQKSYIANNDIEAHAEIYRYSGPQMPAGLKVFYPRKF